VFSSPVQALQLAVRREAIEATGGPESRPVLVAEDLQRLGNSDVRRRGRRGLLEVEEHVRGLAVPSLGCVEQDEVPVRLRVRGIVLDLVAEGLLRLLAAAEAC